MSLVQKAKMHAALAALRATTQEPETHAAVRRLAEADGMLVAEELAPSIVRRAGSLAAERILERGIERYMEDRIVTLRRDGVEEHEIAAYGMAYLIATTDCLSQIEAEGGRKLMKSKSSGICASIP